MSMPIKYLSILLLFLFACQRQDSSIRPDRTRISGDLKTLSEEVITAYGNLDPERILQYYDDGIVHTGNGIITTGRQRFEKILRETLAPVRVFNYLEIEKFEVQIVQDNLGICTVQFREGLTIEGGIELHIRLAISYTWQNVDGSWKIIHESSSFQPLRSR
jgi:ketosteroid isomerase-like protein